MENITMIVSTIVIVAAIIALIAITIWAIKTKHVDVLRKMAYYLVIQAEEIFGGGTGPTKYTWVVEQLMKLLPAWAKAIFNEKDIDNAIEAAVEKLKELLADRANDEELLNEIDAD